MNLKDDEFTRAWEYHVQADNLLAARMSYGMVAQSMLLTAFAMLFVADPTKLGWYLIAVEILVAGFGVAYSIIQILMAEEMLRWMRHLKGTYLKEDALYEKGYLELYKGRKEFSLQKLVPQLLVAVWVMLGLMSVHASWPISN